MPVICLPELCLLKRSWPIFSRFTFRCAFLLTLTRLVLPHALLAPPMVLQGSPSQRGVFPALWVVCTAHPAPLLSPVGDRPPPQSLIRISPPPCHSGVLVVEAQCMHRRGGFRAAGHDSSHGSSACFCVSAQTAIWLF